MEEKIIKLDDKDIDRIIKRGFAELITEKGNKVEVSPSFSSYNPEKGEYEFIHFFDIRVNGKHFDRYYDEKEFRKGLKTLNIKTWLA